MEMSPLLPVETTGSAEHRHLLSTFRDLQNAWFRYWEDVSTFWGSLMKCFSSGGNWMVLKASCIEMGLDKVLSGRVTDLRNTLEEMGHASKQLADSKGAEEMEVLVRTLLTLLSNAAEGLCKAQGAQEPPKQQFRNSQPQQGQCRQHSLHAQPHEHQPLQPITHQVQPTQKVLNVQKPKLPQPQQPPLQHPLQQIQQPQQRQEHQCQKGHQNPEATHREAYRTVMVSDRYTARGFEVDAKLIDARTPRSSLTNTGSSLTVRCMGSMEASPMGSAFINVLRQRSASPLRRPRSGAWSPSQRGPIWTNSTAHIADVRRAAAGYGYVASSPSSVQRYVDAGGRQTPVTGHGAWTMPARSNPASACSGESLFRVT